MLMLSILPKWVNNIIYMFLLLLDSIAYFFVSAVYQLFVYLATARIFEDAFFANFANRIYAILGVFMLFYLAYALLNALVDPEKLAKGDKSVAKLAQNLVISLVLLGLLPSIFNYAYRLQNYILSSNLIGALVMGAPVEDVDSNGSQANSSMIKFGDSLSFTVMNAFINPTNLNVNMSTNYNWFDLKKDILEKSSYSSLPALADAIAYGAPVVGGELDGEVHNVIYYPIISTAVACYLVYILLSFTLDLGVRIIKLAFCQLIAPIPIIMRVMPSKKGSFDKWLKLTITVYLEVFVRVGIMYMSVYFVKSLVDNETLFSMIGDGIMGMFALVVVILGIFTFAKQAPKLLSDVLGIDSSNMKLGIGEKIKAGGFFGLGSAVGAAFASGFNPFAISRAWKAGNKDGNFQQIGKESLMRRKVLNAREEGSTWSGRRYNDIRRYFGYDTVADAMDRNIEHMPYVDENGNRMTKQQVQEMQARKVSNQETIAQINERSRLRKQETAAHEIAQKNAHEALERAKSLVNRDNSAYTGTIDGAYGQINGNLATMREAVNTLRENGVDRAAYTAYDSQKNEWFDEDGYRQALADHANVINQYQREINKMERSLTDQITTDAMNGTSLNPSVDNDLVYKIQKAIDSNDASVVTHDRTEITDGASIRAVEDNYKALVSQTNNDVQNIEHAKVAIEQDNAVIDRIEAIHKSQQEAAKQSSKYRAEDASRKISK